MALRIKRGTNAERLSYTPELGELIYVTDYESAGVSPVWIGDGSTTGGNEVSSGSGGSGITDIVNDTTPQLGGNLDLNSYDITGTGDIDTTGNINATGSIDVNLNIDAGGYVNATTMAANLFNGNFDGDLTGSVFGDDSTVLVDGNNNRLLASIWSADNTLMVNTVNKSFAGSNLILSSDTANITVDSTITAGNGVSLEARGHNGTVENPTVVTAGDTVYNLVARGYDGDSYENSAVIKMGADKYTTAIADGIVPGRIVFLTYNESGATSTDNAMVFNRFGNLGIKTDAPAQALDVRGNGVFTGNVQAASMTGTFVADDSTILVDGVAGKVNVASSNIEELSNVVTTSPQAGQVLKYNGSEWVNDVDVAGSGGSGGIGNIGVGADDSTVRLINSGESFLVLGGTAITTTSDAEGNITINGVAQDFAFSSLTGKPTTIAGYGITDAFDGVFASLTSKPTTIAGYGITDAVADFADLGNKPTTLAGYGITDAVAATDLGSFTYSGSTVDTSDSSGITIIPAVTAQSDVTIENNLYVTNKVVADSFESTSTGTPEITAASNLNLTAGNAVVITSSPLRQASFTTAERDALASQNGDMIYNSTTNKFQGYANGAWVDLH